MAIRSIAHAIQAGETSFGWAVGAESMSLNPRPSPEVAETVSQHEHAHDSIQPMGWTSENVAKDYNIPRQKQDYYALISHTRASEAVKKGLFTEEILPIEVKGQIISVDDTIRPGVTAEGLAALKSAFPQWQPGTTTAGNASGVGDGAGLVMMTTRERAEAEGMEILGKWIGSTVVGVEPRYMGISPVFAVPKLLKEVGLRKEDVDIYEINEAFASQFAYCVEQLDIPIEKINPNGGSIAISHPIGLTGIRQVVTGLAELKRRNEKVLLTSMCVGSGMGAAGMFVNEQVR